MKQCYRTNCENRQHCDNFRRVTCLELLTEKQANLIAKIRRDNGLVKCTYISNNKKHQARVNVFTGELFLDGQAIQWGKGVVM